MELVELVERADLDELVRVIDGLCDARDWADLLELRDRCTRAVERGKQLWPAAHLAEYRLALDAPGEYAGAVLVEGAGRFGLGPIAEVAATTHGWRELAPHAPAGPVAALCAHERVLRGEDLRGERLAVPVLDLPLRLESWEPEYALATYRPGSAEFPTPDVAAPLDQVALPRSAERIEDPTVCRALVDLAETWTTGSDGSARTSAVRGDRADAIRALGVDEARIVEIDGAAALAVMAWTAASGGAFGRRRGAASGRLAAWVAAAAVVGLDDVWPIPADRLGGALGTRRWWVFADDGAPPTGWSLRLAVEDLDTERAWAVVATDHR